MKLLDGSRALVDYTTDVFQRQDRDNKGYLRFNEFSDVRHTFAVFMIIHCNNSSCSPSIIP